MTQILSLLTELETEIEKLEESRRDPLLDDLALFRVRVIQVLTPPDENDDNSSEERADTHAEDIQHSERTND